MKLYISDENHPFKREIEVIFGLFKEELDELVFTNNPGQDSIKIEVFNDHNLIRAEAILPRQEGALTFKKVTEVRNKEETKSSMKRAVSFIWLKLLESVYGKTHDWGVLTGIRPTKLYHKLLQHFDHQEIARLLKQEYAVASEKINILQTIIKRQLEVVPDLYEADQEISLYIGIPFCPTKCAYCTFPAYAINSKTVSMGVFLETLAYEIAELGKWISTKSLRVTTIYFGGGTPTSLEANQLDWVFQQLSKYIDLETVREITVEAGRPDTITKDKLAVMNKWKVNRISINPQTFTEETLKIIGRHHTVTETIEKYHLARKQGVANINMDLIIGLPGEDRNDLIHSLSQIEILKPESITIHTMAFKRASYLTKNKEKFVITEPKEVKEMMEYAKDWTEKHDYYPYYLYRQKNMLGNLENIGYSILGKESIYNILIMEEKQTIIGIGSGAVSKLKPPSKEEITRYPNPKDPKIYVERIKEVTEEKIKQLNQIFL